MGIKLRLPQINATTDREMLMQIRSYLFQTVPLLQMVIDNYETNIAKNLAEIERVQGEVNTLKQTIRSLEAKIKALSSTTNNDTKEV